MENHTDRKRLDIALLFDSPDENWPSMDLAGEMLFDEWRSNPLLNVEANKLSIRIPPILRRIPRAGSMKGALNADRALARYMAYPLRAFLARRPHRLFHVVDHSYAHLVHALPAARTGVYCHDLDAFRPILPGGGSESSPASRALARVLLAGLRSARLVFHSTRQVGREIIERDLVPASRLIHAPYGVAPEFTAAGTSQSEPALVGAHPFILHVGSGIPRKRLDVLFEVFARARATRPELRLVQQGATLSPAQRAYVERLGIADALIQPPKLSRAALAGLYRRAAVVLVTSDAEGFGFPVIEALAAGAIVVASDIPVLREVGSDAALYAPTGNLPAWSATVATALGHPEQVPSRERRLARARDFTWRQHARTILDAYRGIEDAD